MRRFEAAHDTNFFQCCGAGAGGAENYLRPGAGANIIFLNTYLLQSILRMLG